MKTINIILPNDISEISAAKNRVLTYLDILKYKYHVNLITFSKDQKLEIEGVKLYFIDYFKIEKSNFFKRVYDEIKLSYKLVSLSNKIKSDFTLITIPTIFLAPIGLILKQKLILDIRDIQWEYLNNRVVKFVLRCIMNNSIKKYNYIIVTNNCEYKYFKKNKLEPILIYNGISMEKFNKIVSLNYKLNDEVTYIGNIGIAQNIMTLVKVAEELPEITFNIIGDGIEFGKIKKYIKEHNIKNVNLTGKLNWQDILKYYEKSKILFAQLGDEFRTAMPSKLYEYAATGLSIVYGGSGEAANFVKKLENGKIFNSGDCKECKKLIIELLDKKIEISETNRKFVQNNFIREKNALKLIDILKKL